MKERKRERERERERERFIISSRPKFILTAVNYQILDKLKMPHARSKRTNTMTGLD